MVAPYDAPHWAPLVFRRSRAAPHLWLRGVRPQKPHQVGFDLRLGDSVAPPAILVDHPPLHAFRRRRQLTASQGILATHPTGSGEGVLIGPSSGTWRGCTRHPIQRAYSRPTRQAAESVSRSTKLPRTRPATRHLRGREELLEDADELPHLVHRASPRWLPRPVPLPTAAPRRAPTRHRPPPAASDGALRLCFLRSTSLSPSATLPSRRRPCHTSADQV